MEIELKTSDKMIKEATKEIKNNKSIVFDATNSSKEKRSEYIDFAKEHNIPVRCIHVNTSYEESMERNRLREKPVPTIVYNIYKKNFQPPMDNEDCEVLIV